MRQRQGQEFIDRVGGFGPEPADQRSPAAILAEQQRIKSKGRKRLRPRAPPFEPARGFDGDAFVRGCERLGERTAPSRRNFHERVVVKTHERRLERAGQRQIIVGQQRRAADGDEIHHRDMVFKLEPVSAGGLHIRGLERPNHRLEKDVAAANQDHDIALADAPDFAGRGIDHPLGRGRPQPTLDHLGDPLGEHHRGVVLCRLLEHAPVFRVRRGAWGDRRPQLDHAFQVSDESRCVLASAPRRRRRRAKPVRSERSCRRRRELSATSGTRR